MESAMIARQSWHREKVEYMRVIGQENRIYAYGLFGVVSILGWRAGYTEFELLMAYAAAAIIYLLVCMTDYLQLIAQSTRRIGKE